GSAPVDDESAGANPPTAAEYRAIRGRADALERRQAELEQEIKSLRQTLSRVPGLPLPVAGSTSLAPGSTPPGKRILPGQSAEAQGNRPDDPAKDKEVPATKSTIPILSESGSLIAATPQQQDRVRAFSKFNGRWRTYVPPKGTKVLPVLYNQLLALWSKGPEVHQLAVFCAQTGEWYTKEVEPPFKGDASPSVDGLTAFYVLGNRVYAFSTIVNKWDVVEMAKGSTPTRLKTPLGPGYQDGQSLYVFVVEEGKWERLDWETIESKPDSPRRNGFQ
ncbi:hypothetical protein ACYOEI_35770, partial [Singulisphaera rosea]